MSPTNNVHNRGPRTNTPTIFETPHEFIGSGLDFGVRPENACRTKPFAFRPSI